MRKLEWLGVGEVEKEVRRALKIPRSKKVEVRHANFAKIKVQKFFVTFNSQKVLATFFADLEVAKKESLVLDYLRVPKKLYFKNGLLVREKIEGTIPLPQEFSDEVLKKLARILLAFRETPVSGELKKHRLSFAKMKQEALKQLPAAEKSFSPFRGSKEALAEFSKVLSLDWGPQLRKLPRGFVHGDFQPANILLNGGKISLIDFDRGGYFYPLFDVASFAVQFTHTALLTSYQRGEGPDRREVRRRVQVFLKEYRQGLGESNLPGVDSEEVFRLFKLLIIFNGLAFSTAGFRKKVSRGHKHLLFGLFRQELKWFAERNWLQ